MSVIEVFTVFCGLLVVLDFFIGIVWTSARLLDEAIG